MSPWSPKVVIDDMGVSCSQFPDLGVAASTGSVCHAGSIPLNLVSFSYYIHPGGLDPFFSIQWADFLLG